MLVYTHAFDITHAIFRIITLFSNTDNKPLSIEQIRIFDFLIAFPFFLSKVRKTKNIKIRSLNNKYDTPGSYQQCFLTMYKFQIKAINTLISKKILLNDGKNFLCDANFISSSLIQNNFKLTKEQKEAIKIINNMLIDLEINGKNGLKSRSRLMESSYD